MPDLDVILDPVKIHIAFVGRAYENAQAAGKKLRARVLLELYQYAGESSGRYRSQGAKPKITFESPQEFLEFEQVVNLLCEQVTAYGTPAARRALRNIRTGGGSND